MSDAFADDSVAWDEAVSRSRSRNRTFMIPDVLSERLDALVGVVDSAGGRLTRADIVCALLYSLSPDPGEIERLVRAYRTATVESAYIGERRGSRLQLGEAHPGPRPRR